MKIYRYIFHELMSRTMQIALREKWGLQWEKGLKFEKISYLMMTEVENAEEGAYSFVIPGFPTLVDKNGLGNLVVPASVSCSSKKIFFSDVKYPELYLPVRDDQYAVDLFKSAFPAKMQEECIVVEFPVLTGKMTEEELTSALTADKETGAWPKPGTPFLDRFKNAPELKNFDFWDMRSVR